MFWSAAARGPERDGRDGETERWRDGEMERRRDGETERWRDGTTWKKETICLKSTSSPKFTFDTDAGNKKKR